MIQHPGIDPVAISVGPFNLPLLGEVGPLAVHWYGLMYLVGFGAGALLGIYRAKKPGSGWTRDEVMDLLFYVAVGVIVGGRLGYVLFYNLVYYLENPLSLAYVWTGGMSFHGGLIGVVVAFWLFAKYKGKTFLQVGDFLAPLCALGLGAGRIGNFINQELWGAKTDLPWGVVFETAGTAARHPSQLYEAFLEGLVLFAVIWVYSAKERAPGRVCGLFILLYGLFRILVEFFREPDAHLGYLAFDWVTMGQVLSLPLVLLGAWLCLRKSGVPRADAQTGSI